MKKTLFKVIVYIFCVFSIVELFAEENIDDLEKKNFFKIERLEADIKLLKDQYKLLTEQQRLDIEKKSESEEVLGLYNLEDRVVVVSYGEEQPVAIEHNEEAWEKNRRVEFVYY